MSYTYLQEQGEESSADYFSDIGLCVLLKSMHIAENHYCNGSVMESCRDFQSGMMSQPSTASRGEESWIASAEDSRAKTSHAPEKAQESTANDLDCGIKWRELLVKWDRASSSWKTRRCLWDEVLPWSSATLPKWGMMRGGECWERLTSEPPIIENDCGFLPNLRASAASQWPCWKREETGEHRSQIEDFLAWLSLKNGGHRVSGRTVNPDFADWLMVWPIGWSDCEPLEMAKFQQWQQWHGAS